MSRFAETLKSSLEIFLKHPRLIIPKLIVALLYSFTILATTGLLENAIADPSLSLLTQTVLLLGFVIAIGLVDIVASATYPFMVGDARSGKKVSVIGALARVFSRPRKILVPAIIVEMGLVLALFLLSLPLSFMIAAESDYTLAFTLVYAAVVLAVVFLFYSLYPVLAYEKGSSVVGSLKRTIEISIRNKPEVGKATAVSLLLSLLSIAIAFTIEFFPQNEGTPLFWLAFIIIRFLTAYVYSYLYVLNPVFYLEYAKGR